MTDEIAKEAARKKALAYYERAVFLEADPGLLGSLGLFAMLGIAGGLFRLTGGSLDIACLAGFLGGVVFGLLAQPDDNNPG